MVLQKGASIKKPITRFDSGRADNLQLETHPTFTQTPIHQLRSHFDALYSIVNFFLGFPLFFAVHHNTSSMVSE